MAAPKISRAAMARLAEGGMSATTISTLFDLPYEKVEEALVAAGVERSTPEVTDIQKAMRALALRVIEETMVMLDEAAPAVKTRLLSNMFSRMISLATHEDSSTMEDLRDEMSKMFEGMKGGPGGVDQLAGDQG